MVVPAALVEPLPTAPVRLALGVDLSKREFHVELRSATEVLATHCFANTPAGCRELQQWLLRQQRAFTRRTGDEGAIHACVEATGRYGDLLVESLSQPEHPVGIISVVNARQIKHFAHVQLRRHKTDKADASLIAQFCLTMAPPPTPPENDDQRTLKELTRHLDALKRMRTQEQNRLTSGLRSPQVRRTVQEHLDFLSRQIGEVEAEIESLSHKSTELAPAMELLTSIPGIGPLTAACFLAEVGDIHRFGHVNDLIAFAGLNPTQHESGTSVRRRQQISKVGNRHLRRAFNLPALTATRFNLARQMYYEGSFLTKSS